MHRYKAELASWLRGNPSTLQRFSVELSERSQLHKEAAGEMIALHAEWLAVVPLTADGHCDPEALYPRMCIWIVQEWYYPSQVKEPGQS